METYKLIAAYAVPILAAAAIAFAFLWWYNRRERRRYKAHDAAVEFGKNGFKLGQQLAAAYAVGDYSGVGKIMYRGYRTLKTQGLPGLFHNVFWKMLPYYIRRKDMRAHIVNYLKIIDDQEKSGNKFPMEMEIPTLANTTDGAAAAAAAMGIKQ